MNKNLVIVRAGDNSLHPGWLEPGCSKIFDIWVDYYGDNGNVHRDKADYYSKTGKVPNMTVFIEQGIDIIRGYDAIWFPDDDISCDAKTISIMFSIFEQYGFELAQPSLTIDSFASHQITYTKNNTIVRFTNFVEAMVPIFSFSALFKCYRTFSESVSGWGTDLVWPKLLGYPKHSIGIIDVVQVKHTRQVGVSDRYQMLTGKKISCVEEMQMMVKKYGIEWPYKFEVYSEIKSERE